MIGTGELESLTEARKLILNSFEPDVYEAKDSEIWEKAYQKYIEIKIK
jgi:hypothetical protein